MRKDNFYTILYIFFLLLGWNNNKLRWTNVIKTCVRFTAYILGYLGLNRFFWCTLLPISLYEYLLFAQTKTTYYWCYSCKICILSKYVCTPFIHLFHISFLAIFVLIFIFLFVFLSVLIIDYQGKIFILSVKF